MRVIHVVGTISVESSGPSQSVPALATAQAKLGLDVELLFLDFGGSPVVPGVASRAFPRSRVPGFRFAAWSADLLWALLRRSGRETVIHSHGLWHFPTIYPGWVHAARRVPVVVSPRGALARFIRGRSPIKKRISSLIGQRYTLEHAALLHATSEAEADDVRSYGVTAPILVAPNGTTFAEPLEAVRRVPGRVVFLGRLHPVKAIDRLLDAWHFIEASLPEAELLIAGPDEDGFGSKMQLYASRLGLQRVRFVGEVRGRAKRELLASAETLVLPSMNENFGMVVIEALAEGTPVVASRGTPWAALEEEALGRWVANTPADLADAMLSLLRLEQPDRLAMSAKAMSWVRDKFDSAKSARTLAEAYGRML